MTPLIVLLSVFVSALLLSRIIVKEYLAAKAARIALSAMLLVTAIGHFKFTNGMAMMLPTFMPYKAELVFFTGIIEIFAAIGLLIPKLRYYTAWLLMVFFVLILPANIYAAINHINYQSETMDGYGASYLWFRIPLQLLFIFWTYYSSLSNNHQYNR